MNVREKTDGAIRWLLDGDPAIRWQTLRDLAGAHGHAGAREGGARRLGSAPPREAGPRGHLGRRWNCRRPYGATHGSVHTTISALEGLRLYEAHRGRRVRQARAAQRRGREFLLAHRPFRSHRTGRVIKPEFTRFSFPPRWHYDILRALDHFQAVGAPSRWNTLRALRVLRWWEAG